MGEIKETATWSHLRFLRDAGTVLLMVCYLPSPQNSVLFFLSTIWLDALKRIEKIIWENAFEQKTKNPRLKFNPELALISLRTTGPWTVDSNLKSIRSTLPNVSFEIFSKLIAKKSEILSTYLICMAA